MLTAFLERVSKEEKTNYILMLDHLMLSKLWTVNLETIDLISCHVFGCASDLENVFMQVPNHPDTPSCQKNRID